MANSRRDIAAWAAARGWFLGCLGAALSFASLAAASSVDVRCARLSERAGGELHARARLLLLGAGLDSAHIGVGCNRSRAWLVWVDGSQSPVDEASGLVEGALDAIENRIGETRKAAPLALPRRSPALVAAPPSPSDDPFSLPESSGAPSDPQKADDAAPKHTSTSKEPTGGVGLSTAVEIWPDLAVVGPHLDVALGIAKSFAFVIAEGARFGLKPVNHDQVMVFDLQGGFAIGAPFRARSTVGALVLFGAERVAVSSTRFGDGAWGWVGAASVGLRASAALGSFDGWLGVNAIVRTTSLAAGPDMEIPSVSAMFSLGGFLPAFESAPEPSKSEPRETGSL